MSCINIEDSETSTLPLLRGFPSSPAVLAGQFLFEDCPGGADGKAFPNQTDWPLMWLRSNGIRREYFARTQILTVRGADVRRLESNGRLAGSCWSDSNADYCLLAGILPDDIRASRTIQTRQVFENVQRILNLAGMSVHNVVRTWLFLDGLLDWYSDFNAARTRFFREHGMLGAWAPASTGIGIANLAGAALIAGALAIRPKHPGVTITAVDSPLQCSAMDYHSAFSRAVELGFPGCRRLLISGTAAIGPDGASMHREDVNKQMALTLRVVQAILESRGMRWDSAVRAIAYFARREDMPLLGRHLREHGMAGLSLVNVHADVCRPELLFEIELDVVADRNGEANDG